MRRAAILTFVALLAIGRFSSLSHRCHSVVMDQGDDSGDDGGDDDGDES